MGKGDGKYWKGQGKWGPRGDKGGNWISQPEEPEMKRPRMDKGKGKDKSAGMMGMGKGMLGKGMDETPLGEMELLKGAKGGLGKGPLMPAPTGPAGIMIPAPNPGMPLMPMPQGLPLAKACPAPAPMGKLVLLAPATKHITPVSSKAANSNNKKIAMGFVHASKDVQAQMLKDPAVARAILQTLAESPGGNMALAGAPGALPTPLVPRAPILPQFPVGAPPAAPAWTGVITLARNMAKKTPFRAALIQGKVSDVEVVLRSAAANASIADITHRVPFDEVGKKVASSSILSLVPNTIMEQASFEEYSKYFRNKSRAGVARLDESLALYVMPCGEDIPALKDSLYTLGPHIPRVGCLIGLIGPGTAAVNAAPQTARPVKQEAEEKPKEKEEKPPEKKEESAPEADAPEPQEGDGMSSKELMDLFSNPDLIQLLSKEVAGGDTG